MMTVLKEKPPVATVSAPKRKPALSSPLPSGAGLADTARTGWQDCIVRHASGPGRGAGGEAPAPV